MIQLIESLNLVLATGGLVVLGASALLIFDLFTNRTLATYVETWGIAAAFLVTAGSSVTTLIYSEVFGFVPCGLCWFQRIFMYPLVFIFAVALYTKDRTFVYYNAIALSIVGVLIALYQHYLQMGGAELVTCPATGANADCAARFLFEFGFITFPLLSAFTFTFVIVLSYYHLRSRRVSV